MGKVFREPLGLLETLAILETLGLPVRQVIQDQQDRLRTQVLQALRARAGLPEAPQIPVLQALLDLLVSQVRLVSRGRQSNNSINTTLCQD